MKYSKNFLQEGFSIMEIVIASSILLLSVVTIFASFTISVKSTLQNTPYIQAGFLLEEGNEAVKNLRDWGWTSNISSLSNGTNYRLAYVSPRWYSTTTLTFIDGKFDRTFSLSSVSRDASHNVVTSGGTVDTNTRKVTVSISWRVNNATTTKTMESYVSNIFSN